MFYLFNRMFRTDKWNDTHLTLEQNGNVNARYNYWVEMLMQRASRLFVWDGLPDTIPQYEIEQRLCMTGYCIASDKPTGYPIVYYGSLANLTGDYFDVPLSVSYYSPRKSGVLNVGTECAFGRNTAYLSAILPIAEYYATLLAHTDTSFILSAVNDRLKGGIPLASTNKAVNAAKSFRKSLFDGKVMPIYDPAFATVDFKDIDVKNSIPLNMYTEVQLELISRFYNDIGVKTSRKKKGNMIEEEVNADSAMLLINIGDMLEQRMKFAKDMSDLFSANITVDISPEIKNVIEGGLYNDNKQP